MDEYWDVRRSEEPCDRGIIRTKSHDENGISPTVGLGCKPFQEKTLEIEISCTSDSAFSPDSEYGFKKSYDAIEPFI